MHDNELISAMDVVAIIIIDSTNVIQYSICSRGGGPGAARERNFIDEALQKM